MKTLFLSALLSAVAAEPGGGDREKGLELYGEGRFEEAAAAFRLAIQKEGESAELQYNLALASWRAGDLVTAETAVEKYAALGGNPRVDLHAGLLGAVRYQEAKELESAADAAMQPPSDPESKPRDPLLILGQALVKAQQAKGHFVRGASKEHSPELLRNTERTLRYIDELEKKIEELKKQREEQQDNEEDNKDEQKSEDEPKDDEKKKPEENEKGEGEENQQEKGKPKPDEAENQEGSQDPTAPEPKNQPEGGEEKPGEQQPPEPKEQPGESESSEPSEEQQPEPQRSDAPGEGTEGRELSPEQTQRLLEQLSELESKLKALRNRAKSRRRPVERDW